MHADEQHTLDDCFLPSPVFCTGPFLEHRGGGRGVL